MSFAFCLLLVSTPAAAEWKRLDSPNFVVVGDVSAGDLKDIARTFEAFREALSRMVTPAATASAVPTIVVVFPSDGAFTPFKPRYKGKPAPVGALFLPRQDVNYIALVRGMAERDRRAVFHEYAHAVVSSASRATPLWLNEGLAEYFSTFELSPDGREGLVGRTVLDHQDRLNPSRLMPLDELLKVERQSPLYDEAERRSAFYAQAWALTHLLLHGQPSRREQLAGYLERVANGSAEMDAWQQTFGKDSIDRELSAYVGKNAFRTYRYAFDSKAATVEPTVVPVPRADSDALLADFLVQQQRYDEASGRLDKLLKTEADSPWLTTVRALLDATRNDRDTAAKRLSSVSVSSDWLVAYLAGSALADLIESRRGSSDAGAQQAVATLFATALKGGQEIPNVLARAARLELLKDQPPPYQTVAAIQRAMKLAPGRTEYVFLYARALALMSSHAAAAGALRPLTTGAYPNHVRDTARRLLDEIDLRQKAQGLEAAARAAAAAAAREAEAAAREAPAAATEPLFRQLESGEQRLEGALQRIECAGGSAIFHVLTAEGLLQARAPKMTQVEFITYRDDVTGTMTCGALKEPMPVYVTWRPAADGKGGRTAVAIEFLPKPDANKQ